jgi:hypothetical protein
VVERIIWNNQMRSMYNIITPEGPQWCYSSIKDRFYVDHMGKRSELKQLRINKMTEESPFFWYFYPIAGSPEWVALGWGRNFKIGHISADRLISNKEIKVYPGKPPHGFPDIDYQSINPAWNESRFMDLGFTGQGDLHLFAGNTKLLYRTIFGKIEYHIYHVLDDRIEDIALEEAERIKQETPDIIEVRDTTRQISGRQRSHTPIGEPASPPAPEKETPAPVNQF